MYHPSTVLAIVSNCHLLRLGLQHLVEKESWIRHAGHATNAKELEGLLSREVPHIVIVDSAIWHDFPLLVQRLKSTNPQIRVILLSGIPDSARFRESIECGADSIVLKVQPTAALLATIRSLSAAGVESAPRENGDITGAIQKPTDPIASANGSNAARWPVSVTERERDVMRLVCQGLSNKEIADRLCISSITVRHHLTAIFDKLGVSTRQKLIIHAYQYENGEWSRARTSMSGQVV
jgi:DNA-binding NarL/FixJ family response regulator